MNLIEITKGCEPKQNEQTEQMKSLPDITDKWKQLAKEQAASLELVTEERDELQVRNQKMNEFIQKFQERTHKLKMEKQKLFFENHEMQEEMQKSNAEIQQMTEELSENYNPTSLPEGTMYFKLTVIPTETKELKTSDIKGIVTQLTVIYGK